MMLKITSNSDDSFDNFQGTKIKQLYESYIKSKYTKIVRHKKMTPIIFKLQEIHADL